jgi:hypothetical protein
MPPTPDGLELYLDRVDLAGPDWRREIQAQVAEVRPPSDFTWIVEAPIRTLEDRYFDLTADDEDHRETLRRVVAVGHDLGAVAANIHLVAPTLDCQSLSNAERERRLAGAIPLLEYYASLCASHRLIPQVENIPPVGRMRESAYVFSAIGSAARDLIELGNVIPSLRFTVDVSHAALYVNWRAATFVADEFAGVNDFHQRVEDVASVADFITRVQDRIVTIHVSNASGLLGEGLLYGDGDEALDVILGPTIGLVPYFVTETLEPDPDRAVGMRDAQERLRRLIAHGEGTAR